MSVQKFIRPAGHKRCKMSTGVCDRLTHGSGHLDGNGYWEFPCEACAREWERQYPHEGECWPPEGYNQR